MSEVKSDKIQRVLGIYKKLMEGHVVNKAEEALRYGVNERSIQRDIEDVRAFVDCDTVDTGITNFVVYDREVKGYRLERIYDLKLTNAEILAICKILLDSRAFTKAEMENMLKRLIECCVPESNRKMVQHMIDNEAFHYIQPHHNKVFIDKMWTIANAIDQCRWIEIMYQKLKNHEVVQRKLKPVAVTFSEFYFYLIAFSDDKEVEEMVKNRPEYSSPTIYRIDRIQRLIVLDEHFKIPYANRFEEGEFRKRVQFMMGGKYRKVRFKYTGLSIEAVLDRLPTAKIIGHDESGYEIEAEVFGDGINMWLMSQEPYVKQIE